MPAVNAQSGDLPVAGWYDDRHGNYMRWWDGRRWTRDTQLIPGRAAVTTQPSWRPISGLEHFLHLNLTLITSGLWGFVWHRRHKKGRIPAAEVIGPRPGDPNESLEPVTVKCKLCGGRGPHWGVRGVDRVWVDCPAYQTEYRKTWRPPPAPHQFITTDRRSNR